MTYPSPPPFHGHPRQLPAPDQMPVESSPTVPFRFRTPVTTYPAPSAVIAPPAPQLHHRPPVGPMPPQFPFGDGPVEPPRKPRKRLVLGAVGTGVIVAAAAAAFAGINWMNANNEKNDIQSLVGDFAAAVDSGDAATVAQYLCAEEAAALTAAGGAEQAPTSAAAAGDAAAAPAASASEITVKGDVASAVVSATDAAQDSSAAKTMYFAKEDGAWKVCMAAESDFPTEQ